MPSYAVVRVWLKASKKLAHVSLQLIIEGEETYVSIYPLQKVSKFVREGVEFQIKTLEQDNEKYKKIESPYECILDEDVYALDLSAMKTEYEKIRVTGFKFSLLASTFLKSKETYNCAGLVLHLLDKGGFTNLLSYSQRTVLKARMMAPSPRWIMLLSAVCAAFLFYKIKKISQYRDRIEDDISLTLVRGERGHLSDELDNAILARPELYHYDGWDGRAEVSDEETRYPYNQIPRCFTAVRGSLEAMPGDVIIEPVESSEIKPLSLSERYTHGEKIIKAAKGAMYFTKMTAPFAFSLLSLMNKTGKTGIILCSVVCVAGLMYVAFCGTGTVASVTIITPTDIAKMLQHITRRQRNHPVKVSNSIAHTFMPPPAISFSDEISSTPMQTRNRCSLL